MPFPTSSDFARIAKYQKYYKLFKGDHDEVFQIADYLKRDISKRELLYLSCNFAGLISKISADFLFLEPLKIDVRDNKTEEILRDIYQGSSLQTVLYQAALTQSYAGTAWLKVHFDGQRPVISEVPPELVFPEIDQADVGKGPQKITIGYFLEIGEREYMFQEIHTPGQITNKLFSVDGDGQIDKEVSLRLYRDDLEEEIETGLSYIPIFKISNFKTGREFFGFSDYHDLESLMADLNERVTQISNQLNKHMNAKLAVPEGVLDEKGEVANANFEMVEIRGGESGAMIPRYITNENPQIENGFRQIDNLLRLLAMFSETSDVLLGLDAKGGVEKVGALRLRILRTLAKIARKRNFFDAAIKKALYCALDFYRVHVDSSIEPVYPQIVWGNPLPEDSLEKAQIEEIRLRSGNASLESSLRRLDSLEGESLKKEISLINKKDV